MLEDLLPYYEQELIYLRRMSAEFAEQYPKIAGRLQLQGDVCADPHVERLIEGFAFLAARIHKRLDDDLPEASEALLGSLYPHLIRTVPSMSIVQFQLDSEGGLTGRYEVPRHLPLRSQQAVNGVRCAFRTAYPVDLWPVRVVSARFEPIERSAFARQAGDLAATIRIKLACHGDLTFDKLQIDRLRFFIDGDSPIVHTLYELIHNSTREIVVMANDQNVGSLDRAGLVAVGFDEDEELLDYDARSLAGYRLLQEYFAFPEKFLFFEVKGLAQFAQRMKLAEIDLVLGLGRFERAERVPRLVQAVDADTFRLGCTPIVNLFAQPCEPIRLTNRQHEYQVIPDLRRPNGLEVYSVDWVRKLGRSQADAVVEYQAIHSRKHWQRNADAKRFWYPARRESPQKGDKGTDVYLSFVDLDFSPNLPAEEIVSVQATCTNRDIPALLPFGGGRKNTRDLEAEEGVPVTGIRLLRKPTTPIRPALRHGTRWRLISHLSLNYLSIVQQGRDALLELLSLYNLGQLEAVNREIAAITQVDGRSTVARVGPPQRVAYVQGTEIELEFDETEYAGSGVYLFASVLERFFALYASPNSFTRLVVRTKQRERRLAEWAPRSGTGSLL